MTDLSSVLKNVDTSGIDDIPLREAGASNSIGDTLKRFLESGQESQDYLNKLKDMALNDPDPIKRNLAKNGHNEMLKTLEMQWALGFLRVGTELAKLPSTLKNG
jgi:hypothetical protein